MIITVLLAFAATFVARAKPQSQPYNMDIFQPRNLNAALFTSAN